MSRSRLFDNSTLLKEKIGRTGIRREERITLIWKEDLARATSKLLYQPQGKTEKEEAGVEP